MVLLVNIVETNIDCVSHACDNGSTCIDGIADYSCTCTNGYEGDYCEINVDDCASNPCQMVVLVMIK